MTSHVLSARRLESCKVPSVLRQQLGFTTAANTVWAQTGTPSHTTLVKARQMLVSKPIPCLPRPPKGTENGGAGSDEAEAVSLLAAGPLWKLLTKLKDKEGRKDDMTRSAVLQAQEPEVETSLAECWSNTSHTQRIIISDRKMMIMMIMMSVKRTLPSTQTATSRLVAVRLTYQTPLMLIVSTRECHFEIRGLISNRTECMNIEP